MLKFNCLKSWAIAIALAAFAMVAAPVMAGEVTVGENFYSAKPTFHLGTGLTVQKVGDLTEKKEVVSAGLEMIGKRNWAALDIGMSGFDTKKDETTYTADAKFGIHAFGTRPYLGVGYKRADAYKVIGDHFTNITYGVGVRYDLNEKTFFDLGYKYSQTGNNITSLTTHYRF